MKKILLLLTVCFLTSFSNNDRVHQDFSVIENYENIKTRITTGFRYEEIRKIEFIAKYAQKLAKKRDYKGTIFLDFNHFYVDDCDPDYFISYGDGLVKNVEYRSKQRPPLKSDGIVIRQVSRSFDIASTLKLIEYAISNIKSIQATQKPLRYKRNYENSLISSIDTTIVNSIAQQQSSIVDEILTEKIWQKPKEKRHFPGGAYYTKNNKFYLRYSLNRKGKSLELNNIYDFHHIDKYTFLVFDSPSSFYYMRGAVNRGIPKRIIIKDISDYYKPFKVIGIGQDKVAIYIRGFSGEQRTIIYDIKTKKIIQDLDKEFQD